MAIDEMPEPVWEAFSEQFAITFLRDGRDVKPLLQQRSFDILFLDLFLSGEDGLQLLRDIHTTGRSVASEVPLDGGGVSLTRLSERNTPSVSVIILPQRQFFVNNKKSKLKKIFAVAFLAGKRLTNCVLPFILFL